MNVVQMAVTRSVKVNTGNYENTDVAVTLVAQFDAGDRVDDVFNSLGRQADALLRDKVDEIELGKRKVASKAGRFGV